MLGGELELGGRDLPRAQDLTPFRDLGAPSHTQYVSLDVNFHSVFSLQPRRASSLDQADRFH